MAKKSSSLDERRTIHSAVGQPSEDLASMPVKETWWGQWRACLTVAKVSRATRDFAIAKYAAVVSTQYFKCVSELATHNYYSKEKVPTFEKMDCCSFVIHNMYHFFFFKLHWETDTARCTEMTTTMGTILVSCYVMGYNLSCSSHNMCTTKIQTCVHAIFTVQLSSHLVIATGRP